MTITAGMLIDGRRRDASAMVDTLSRATHDGRIHGRPRAPVVRDGDLGDGEGGGEVEPPAPVVVPPNAFVLAVHGGRVDAMIHYPHGQRLERNLPVVNPADTADADVYCTSDTVEAKNPVVEPPVRVDPPDIIPPDIVEPPVVDPPDLG